MSGRLALLLLLSACAHAQLLYPRHNAWAGAAALLPASGEQTDSFRAGAGYEAGYAFRFTRYTAVEAATVGAWPGYSQCTSSGCNDLRGRAQFTHAALRLVLPLQHERTQLWASVGGAAARLPESGYYNQTLLALSLGADYALSRRGPWHLHTALRYYRDPGRPTQQWLVPTAGISFIR